MYCAAFSPAAWRPLKTPDELFVPPPADAGPPSPPTGSRPTAATPTSWKTEKNKAGRSHLDDVTDEAELVEAWRDAVPKVARALANVPTYMIFDDHEITDDWYLSDRWRERVITAPFGRAILRNGLLAYTVFQGWGNDPQAFRHEASAAAGRREEPEREAARRDHRLRRRVRRAELRDARTRSTS